MKKFALILLIGALTATGLTFAWPDDDDKQSTGTFQNLKLALATPEEVRVLDLSGQSLTELPAEIQQLKNLRTLILSDNDLKVVPAEIAKLEGLHEIYLNGNTHLDAKSTLNRLGELSQLEVLDISNCALTFVPYDIGYLTNLKQLDASDNYLLALPDEVKYLRKIESVDLSNNQLKDVDFMIAFWQKLKRLDLSENEGLFLDDLFVSTSLLPNLDHLHLSHVSGLPDEVRDLNARTLKLSDSDLRKLPEKLTENRGLSQIVFENCPNLRLPQVVDVLSKLPQLARVGFNQQGWREVPSELKRLQGINRLDLIGNELSDPASLDEFSHLKTIDLRGNSYEAPDFTYLYGKHPETDIIAGELPFRAQPERTIQEPIPTLGIIAEQTTVSAEEASELQLGATLFQIPENAFVDASGAIVSGKVDLSYREFNDPTTIFLSGIPMKYDSAGMAYDFQSAGMMEFRASQNGVEVFPNPEALIEASIGTDWQGEDFNLYQLDDASGTWETSEQKIEVAQAALDTVASGEADLWNFRRNTLRPTRNRVVKAKIGINVKPHPKSGGFMLEFRNWKTDIESSQAGKTFPDVRLMAQHDWIYDGDHPNRDFARLDSIDFLIRKMSRKYRVKSILPSDVKRFEAGGPEMVSDVRLEVNPEADNYLLTLEVLGKSYVTEVYPWFGDQHPDKEIRGNRRFTKSLDRELRRRHSLWKRTDKVVERERKKYEAEMAAIEEMNRKLVDRNNELGASATTITRSFALSGFGIWNCDRVGQMTAPEKLLADITDLWGNPIEVLQVQVLDMTTNAVFTFGKDNLTFDASSRTALVATLKNDRVAYIGATALQNFQNNVRGGQLPMHIADPENLTVDRLRALLRS